MRFLVFPQCLAFLDALLRSPKFAKELAVPTFADYLHKQQGLHWMHDALLDFDRHSIESTTSPSGCVDVALNDKGSECA